MNKLKRSERDEGCSFCLLAARWDKWELISGCWWLRVSSQISLLNTLFNGSLLKSKALYWLGGRMQGWKLRLGYQIWYIYIYLNAIDWKDLSVYLPLSCIHFINQAKQCTQRMKKRCTFSNETLCITYICVALPSYFTVFSITSCLHPLRHRLLITSV